MQFKSKLKETLLRKYNLHDFNIKKLAGMSLNSF